MTDSSDEGEYDTKDGDSLDEFLQGPSGSSSKVDETRKQISAKVRSLPDLAYLNGLNMLSGDTGCYKPSHLEGVASFFDPDQQHTSYALLDVLAFRSKRKSICIETTAFLQVLLTNISRRCAVLSVW